MANLSKNLLTSVDVTEEDLVMGVTRDQKSKKSKNYLNPKIQVLLMLKLWIF